MRVRRRAVERPDSRDKREMLPSPSVFRGCKFLHVAWLVNVDNPSKSPENRPVSGRRLRPDFRLILPSAGSVLRAILVSTAPLRTTNHAMDFKPERRKGMRLSTGTLPFPGSRFERTLFASGAEARTFRHSAARVNSCPPERVPPDSCPRELCLPTPSSGGVFQRRVRKGLIRKELPGRNWRVG